MFSFFGHSQVRMKPLPQWPSGPRTSATYAALCDELRRHSPLIACEPAQDADYVLLPHALLKAAIDVALSRLWSDGVRYTRNSWDCEDFRNELCQTVRKIAARAGIPVAALIGGIDVIQDKPWANVAAGGTHALALAHTDAGPVVIEAQNGTLAPLSLYPNRQGILRARGF